jgi:hypothetical protein
MQCGREWLVMISKAVLIVKLKVSAMSGSSSTMSSRGFSCRTDSGASGMEVGAFDPDQIDVMIFIIPQLYGLGFRRKQPRLRV